MLERIAKLLALHVSVMADAHEVNTQVYKGYADDIAEQIREIFEVDASEVNPPEIDLGDGPKIAEGSPVDANHVDTFVKDDPSALSGQE